MPQLDHVRRTALLLSLALIFLLTGCASPAAGLAVPEPTLVATHAITPAAPSATAPAATSTPQTPRVWISPALPKAFREQVKLPVSIPAANTREAANLRLEIVPHGAGAQSGNGPRAQWIYALVAPFPTLVDNVDSSTLQKSWLGTYYGPFAGKPLLLTAETRAVLESFWGPANPGSVRVVDPAALVDTAWKEQPAWAIIPFEDIEPRWKVLRVDGISPLGKDFAAEKYPLAVPITVKGSAETLAAIPSTFGLPTNRDPSRLTVLVMTGTTAISRHIGEKMESNGLTYPARDIRPWLAEADLTHISNEVSFYKDCPKPGPERADMRFCSSPKYIQLLEDVGTDIVELTGNHNLDWGPQPFLDTLEMYKQRGWITYGGGANQDAAKKPAYVTHNGNKLVFLGCSPAGPEAVYATQYMPGSNRCDLYKLEQQVRQLRAEGYLPIVTFQAVETDTYKPAPAQGSPDFRRMAKAGAVIVSGSQSHVPQTMTIVGAEAVDPYPVPTPTPKPGSPSPGYGFVHYGLGNLFFDQMSPIEERQEFIDRHVFYNGKYMGVDLLTALLEDASRPRPMEPKERADFLQKVFALCDWSDN